jgi:hypothetical protein
MTTTAPAQRFRRVFGYGVIVAVLPYLVLKVLWVAGIMVGIPEDSPAYSGWAAANAATGVIDFVAILLALALTQNWGMRLPSWLVVVPIWIGTGFLVPAFVEVVVNFAQGMIVNGQLVRVDNGLVEDWTYVVVGSSFALQGLLLAGAFVLYTRRRWADATAELPPGAERGTTVGVQRVLLITGAVLAAVIAVLHLYQALAAPAAWRDGEWTFATRLVEGVEGAAAVLAVLGALTIAGSRLLRTFRAAVVSVWVGAGALFAYGLFRTLSNSFDAPMAETMTTVNRLVNLFAMLAGLVIGIAAAVALSERRAAVRAAATEVEKPVAATV